MQAYVRRCALYAAARVVTALSPASVHAAATGRDDALDRALEGVQAALQRLHGGDVDDEVRTRLPLAPIRRMESSNTLMTNTAAASTRTLQTRSNTTTANTANVERKRAPGVSLTGPLSLSPPSFHPTTGRPFVGLDTDVRYPQKFGENRILQWWSSIIGA
eukprot:1619794-Pyramimonas_sp.AAC.1